MSNFPRGQVEDSAPLTGEIKGLPEAHREYAGSPSESRTEMAISG